MTFLDRAARGYRERLRPRGRALLWATVAFALMGLDTRSTRVFVLFAAAAGIFVTAACFALRGRPRVRVRGALPDRVTAGTPAAVVVSVEGAAPDQIVSIPAPDRIAFLPPEAPAAERVAFTLQPRRRGRYELAGPVVRGTDPLSLMATAARAGDPHVLRVVPRFSSMERFDIPLGRRYQPGGIPLASHTGDSVEFIGTREYRAGDPVRSIHWRSWARRGEPVVKEYQEEYFCRIAVILDTFRPAGDAFEAAVSTVASIADTFSRSEHIVDILAAGPDIFEVSAGRSLGYLENVLDVLATIEPCGDAPFATIGPALFDKLALITTVVAVLQDWDAPRRDFLRRVKALGVGVRVLIVADETTDDWSDAADLGRVERIAPADVEWAPA